MAQSESVLTVCEAIQRTVQKLGHVPTYHQTDNSTAATYQLNGKPAVAGEERTAQSFIPYVVHEHLGAELIYRTGDWVQEDADGNYTYLDRYVSTFCEMAIRMNST